MKIRVLSSWTIFSGFCTIFVTYQLFSSLRTRTTLLDLSCNTGGGNGSILYTDNPSSPSSPAPGITCDRKHTMYDFCMLDGPTIMSPSNSTFYLMGQAQHTEAQKIRPYPRKWERDLMSGIKEISLAITTPEAFRQCQVRHNAPAIVFSNSMYTGNFYHALADGFVPLLVTARTAFPHARETVLVVANVHTGWLTRYAHLLNKFTSYPIINLDNDTRVHCFPAAAVGLIVHGDITINPALMPNSESLRDFHALVHQSFHNAKTTQLTLQPIIMPALPIDPGNNPRPQLVLLARTGTRGRVLVNQAQLVKAAEEVGFQVHVFVPSLSIPLSHAYKLISGSHALLGVHGAGLTHLFFLRTSAVLMQVVPLGLDWASRVYFGKPALEIGLEYVEYKINVEESTLAEKFDRGDEVLKDPESFRKKGWNCTALYLKQQDVRLNLVRFTSYLKVAYDKTKKLMVRDNLV